MPLLSMPGESGQPGLHPINQVIQHRVGVLPLRERLLVLLSCQVGLSLTLINLAPKETRLSHQQPPDVEAGSRKPGGLETPQRSEGAILLPQFVPGVGGDHLPVTQPLAPDLEVLLSAARVGEL